MTDKDDELFVRLVAYQKDERHQTVAESRYWCKQYKNLASDLTFRLRELKRDAERLSVMLPDLVLAAIIQDIRGRLVIGDTWDDLDVDVRNEIANTWRKLIDAAIRERGKT